VTSNLSGCRSVALMFVCLWLSSRVAAAYHRREEGARRAVAYARLRAGLRQLAVWMGRSRVWAALRGVAHRGRKRRALVRLRARVHLRQRARAVRLLTRCQDLAMKDKC
jgi:hypothetical protein